MYQRSVVCGACRRGQVIEAVRRPAHPEWYGVSWECVGCRRVVMLDERGRVGHIMALASLWGIGEGEGESDDEVWEKYGERE